MTNLFLLVSVHVQTLIPILTLLRILTAEIHQWTLEHVLLTNLPQKQARLMFFPTHPLLLLTLYPLPLPHTTLINRMSQKLLTNNNQKVCNSNNRLLLIMIKNLLLLLQITSKLSQIALTLLIRQVSLAHILNLLLTTKQCPILHIRRLLILNLLQIMEAKHRF